MVVTHVELEHVFKVDTSVFSGLVHKQPWSRCPLGQRHKEFQFLPVTSPVSAVFYDMSHPSGTPTSKSRGGGG
jgi:hypothetical protein